MLRSLLLLPLLVLAPLAQAQQLAPEQAALKAHVQFLAADALRGREAGTHEYDIAAQYVATQMLGVGLKPAGEEGWLQPVGLVTRKCAKGMPCVIAAGRRAPQPNSANGEFGRGRSPSSSVNGKPSEPSGLRVSIRTGSPPLMPLASRKYRFPA